MRRSLLMAFCIVVCAGRAAAEDDPVRKKLDDAKATYEKDMEAIRKAAGEWFDKRERAARESGNKNLVVQIKADRESFVEKGTFSKVSAELCQRRNAALSAMETAYKTAIKDYTKGKKDSEARLVEQEYTDLHEKIANSLDGIESVLIGVWRIKMSENGKEMFNSTWTFNPDGTVQSTNGARLGRGTIELDKKRVYTVWGEGIWEALDLPLNIQKTGGESHKGWTKEMRKIR